MKPIFAPMVPLAQSSTMPIIMAPTILTSHALFGIWKLYSFFCLGFVVFFTLKFISQYLYVKPVLAGCARAAHLLRTLGLSVNLNTSKASAYDALLVCEP